jgi:hypothetical protein
MSGAEKPPTRTPCTLLYTASPITMLPKRGSGNGQNGLGNGHPAERQKSDAALDHEPPGAARRRLDSAAVTAP